MQSLIAREAWAPEVRRTAWAAFLGVGVLGLAAYFVLPQSLQRGAYDLFGLAATLAVLAGLGMHRPRPRRPWILLAAGVATYLAADVIYSWFVAPDGAFPSIADAGYLGGMVVIIAAAATIGAVRPERRVDPALVDAILVATAIGVVVWLMVIDPTLDSMPDFGASLVAAAYPVLDLAVVAVIARHMLSGHRFRPSSAMLMAGLAAFTFSDIGYASVSLNGTYAYGDPLDLGWLLGYVFIGASALHPSMARAPEPLLQRDADLTRARRALLVAALTVAILALSQMPLRGPDDVLAALVGAIVIVLLIVARLLGAISEAARRLRETTDLRAELHAQARTDTLTGLANRAAFLAHLERLLVTTGAYVLFLDLDGFKRVNDGFGHAAGDRLLGACADRLRALGRDTDVVARLGGDEFGVALPAGISEEDALAVGQRMLAALEQPVEIGGSQVLVSASVGLTHGPRGADATDLLRDADVAMYAAKAHGGRAVMRFETGAHTGVMRGYRLAADIAMALERDEFELAWQPVVDLASGTAVSLEALIRWRHPEEGLLLPGEFIGLAERSALIDRVDDRALREALRQIRGWRERGMVTGRLPVHVNLSAHQLDADRARSLLDAVRRSGLEPGAIVFEVTEGVLLERTAARAALALLHEAGHRVALDDFGVRYAVLAELTELPFDLVKLDRSFLAGAADPRRARLVSGMVGILRDLGVSVIAEGVETEAERRFLLDAGTSLGQGYLFSRPVSAATLERQQDGTATRVELHAATRAIPA